MRAVLLVLLLQGCAATSSGSGSNSRPGVMPMLSELPGDADKQHAILDSANQTPGPEQRKGQTVKERKAETIGATAAAILGSAFSKTQNVTLGTSTTFGGNRSPAPAKPDTSGTAPLPIEGDEKSKLPWIKLKP